MTKKEYVASVPVENFTNLCLEIASRRESWARIVALCGAELVEEFSNDAIEEIEEQWESENGIEEDL